MPGSASHTVPSRPPRRLSHSASRGTGFAGVALAICGVLLAFDPAPASGPVNACGTISTNTTWTAGNVYVINDCGTTVAAGATLTVQPGTVVKFGGARAALLVDGTLMAQGTAGGPISFTGLRDDSRGGDTNGDGASTGQRGDWSGVRFRAGSRGRLAYVFVGFGGSGAYDHGGRYGAAELESFSSDVILDHVTLRSSGNGGLYCENASVQVSSGQISDNAGYGLYWNGVDAAVPLTVSDTTFSGNGGAGWLHFRDARGTVTFQRNSATGSNNGFRADGRLNQGSLTWDNGGNLPLLINPGMQIAPATTLTLMAGSVVKLSGTGTTLSVQGTLQSQGTAASPVVFTSAQDDSRAGDTNGDGAGSGAPGQWASVRFQAGSQGRVTYTSFEYGGSGAYDYAGRYGVAAVESFSSDVTLDHVTLRASAKSGLYCDNASVRVSFGQVSDNGEYGLRWDGVDASVPLVVSDTTFSNNGTAAGWLHFRDAAGTVTFERNVAAAPKNGFRADGRLNQGSLTWNNGDDLPLLISGGLTIAPATTMNLEPGTVVKFGNPADVLLVQGTIEARGTAGTPVALTSISDDAHGGDTNGDGVSEGQAGQWSGLRFAAGGTGRLAYVFVGYGGSGAYDYAGRYGQGMVESFSSDVILDHCTLHASGNSGLYAENASVAFTNGTVSDNAVYGLKYNGLDAAVPLVVTGNTFRGSQGSAARLDLRGNPAQITFQGNTGAGTQRKGFSLAGTISTNTVWDNTGSIPLIVEGGLTVASGATLTVQPGTVVKFAGPRDVLLVQGALVAIGTEAAPIAFTSLRDDAHGGDTNGDGSSVGVAGDWSGMRFAADSAGQLTHAFLGFGGSGAYDHAGRYGVAMLESFSSNVAVDHCTLQGSGQSGLYALNSSVNVTNSQFVGNQTNGVYYDGVDPTTPLSLRGNTFSTNGAYGAWVRIAYSAAQITVEDNRSVAPKNGLRVSGGLAAGFVHWNNPNAPMVIDGGLAVQPGAALRLEPGTVVKFAAQSDVLQVQGSLAAEGTFSSPIAFTSISDDSHGGDTNGDGSSAGSRGQWAGLRFLSGSNVTLRHCFIGYGGSGAYDHLGVYGRGLVDIRGGRIGIKHGTLRSSGLHGVYTENAEVRIAYASITDHAQNGINNATPNVGVDARHNWWGDPNGPKHATLNPAGTGTSVTNGVVFAPWLNRFTWLDPTTALVHGVTALSWNAFDVNPASLLSDAEAVGSVGTQKLADDSPAGDEVEWNTYVLPGGRYELRATWRDLTAKVVGEAVRSVVVNNDAAIAWHGGTLTGSETWDAAHLHVVEEDVVVPAGVRLTIRPGAVVKFAPGTRIIVADGGIVDALATEPAPVVFTSIADDLSGDTNLDGSRSLPRPGDWNGIVTQGSGKFNDNQFVRVLYTQTEHSGLLSGDERWLGSFVHRVTGDVTVPSGVTLTIDAGAMVKFDAYKGLFVQPGGRLLALGSVAQPIVFTSSRDDTAGGDTNGDGDATAPQPGDWRWIFVEGANATFDHVDMRYGGGTSSGNWDQTGMIRTTGAASVTVTNSVLRDAFFDGILAWGGSVNVRSTVFSNIDRAVCAHPGSPVQVVNCTVDGNRIGLLVHGGTLNVTNTIVSNSHESGLQYDFGTLSSVRYSNVWAPAGSTSVNYRNTADQTGSNGNISRDPRYVDRAHLNYRLDYRSPAIDAADGPAAPATDAAGSPRYDDPRTANTGIPQSGGAYADMGAYEFVETADSNLDLVVSGVTGPTAVVAGDTVRVHWTVTNAGSAQVVGPWHDTVNLVLSPGANPTVIAAGEVLVGSGARLGPGQSFSASAEIRVPGSVVGTHYWQVVTNTRGDVFEGRNRENNAGLSVAPVAVDLPELVVGGAALSRQFNSVGQAHWFKFNPSAGQDVIVRLDRAGTGGATELYIGQGYMPRRERFDARQDERNAPDVSALAASTAAQTYYVLAYPAALPAGSASFTIGARALDFSLTSVGPQQVGNLGKATLALRGGQLRSDMTFEIVDARGGVHAAESAFVANPSVAYVTFDLAGLPTGVYTVRARDGGRTAALSNGVNIIAGTAGRVEVHLTMPKAMRPDWTESVTVDYVNVGDTDVLAPLMVLSVQNAKLRLPGKTQFVYSTVQLLGINHEGPAGVLPPGARGTITLEMKPTAGGGTIDGKLWLLSNPAQPWDWNAAKSRLRPDFVPLDAWDAIFANFTGKVGTTVGAYNKVLADDATYLSRLGEYTSDVQRLLMFELDQAGLRELTRRYTPGAFGRGAPAWWETRASTDAAGNVRITSGGTVRFFARREDGSYEGVPGDAATLMREGEAYRIREPDGTVVGFQSDGRFDYIEDRLGRRTSAVYAGNRLSAITDDAGGVISYTYNAQGRIAQVTDPVGRVTTFTYDATGNQLTAVTDARGTIRFTYDDGQNPLTRYAPRSVAFPDGTHTYFEYDAQGRLARTSRDGGGEAETYTYDAGGSVTVTDAAGSQVVVAADDSGQAARLLDPFSIAMTFGYDDQHRPTRVDGPEGVRLGFQYDAAGNVTGVVDPMGHRTSMAYEPTFNGLTAVTNAAGHTTTYERDARGSLTRTMYPNGTQERFAHDVNGNATAWTNGRGRTVRNTYDATGLLTRQDFPDGSYRTFAYDARRNLIEAADARGTVRLEYDAADRLTRVTYPSGRFLQFAYDAGGRRIRSVDQDGFTVKYAYDALGRLANLTDGTDTPIVSYTYDSVGQLTRKDLGNGTYTTYQYNLNGQVVQLINFSAGGTVLSRFDYTYDALGRRTRTTTSDGQWTYRYDPAGRLTEAKFTSINPAIANQDLLYEYDATGNRVRTIRNGNSVAYATNSADQYTSIGGSQCRYDADGNLISRSDGIAQWTYAYDDENQLIEVVGPDGHWTYEYDVFGNRVAAEHDGERIEYLVDPAGMGNVVGTYDGAGTPIARYAYGLGLAGRADAAGEFAYFHFDALGNTTELSGPDGAVLNSYVYGPFGDRLASVETVANPFQYVGALGVMHEGNGLWFMRARHYHAGLGRFLQRDPLRVPGANAYEYAAGDPISSVDPTGLDPVRFEVIRRMIEYAAGDPALQRFIENASKLVNTPTLITIADSLGINLRDLNVNIVRVAPPATGLAFEWWFFKHYVNKEFIQPVLRGFGYVWRGLGYVKSGVGYLGRGVWSAATRHPLVAAAVVGVAIGTWARTIEGVDEAAQMTLVDLNDWLGGWLLWTPRAAEAGTRLVSSHDPNDILGPAGNGSARWVAADQTLPYKIRFENDKQATAPAQVVRITTQLDSDLDYVSFELGAFNFDGVVVTVPPGRTFYSERLDLRDSYGVFLDITASLDFNSGIVTWEFASIDPVTGATPRDPLTGFLPPNVTSPIGEGYVTYTIRPRSGLAIGTAISAEASIVFDTNEPIDTPRHVNPIGPFADCTGDCDGNGIVAVNELITLVNIALGTLDVQTCLAGDLNGDGRITVNEIITAVNYALSGCPVTGAGSRTQYFDRAPFRAFTATPTATPTPTRTPAET